jgi:hypothetical protein
LNELIKTGTHGLADYWHDMSNGIINLNGSALAGWYTEPHTIAHELAVDRPTRYNDCTSAASRDRVITWPFIDGFGLEGSGALVDAEVPLPELVHEFGHGIGFEHSFSNDQKYQNQDWVKVQDFGEYDDQWDLMSAANIWVDPTGVFGGGPPYLNAYHLDEMGWIPRSRILTLGVDGQSSQTVTLAALNHPEASGYLLVRVAADANDLFHYYTVEFRRADGWDSGFPEHKDVVLIHEIKLHQEINQDNIYHTFLLRAAGSPVKCPGQGAWDPEPRCSDGGGEPDQTLLNCTFDQLCLSISVLGHSGNQATVSVSTPIVHYCLQGYVWREAVPGDLCVSHPPPGPVSRPKTLLPGLGISQTLLSVFKAMCGGRRSAVIMFALPRRHAPRLSRITPQPQTTLTRFARSLALTPAPTALSGGKRTTMITCALSPRHEI